MDGTAVITPTVTVTVLAVHWDVPQDEATEAESQSGLPMFGTRFPS